MEKSVGKYRVKCERDINNKPINDGKNTYIKCKSNCQIYRFDDEVLVLYVPSIRRGKNYLKLLKSVCFKYESGDKEVLLYFYEKDIEEILKIVQPFIQGRNIKPKNKRSYKS
ncbi:hypothetical protein K144316041_p20100 (plasmid) [Clostridium tetani]|uniref:hypothetical protein n=1 Tax=Clostridium tetani TaxID=1513 RepID=UPI00295386AA|nr:hypothetical protein [Clostridium tetani]BDR74171.1 hypothetical protein K144316041_p20100 [Clostridium tetani]